MHCFATLRKLAKIDRLGCGLSLLAQAVKINLLRTDWTANSEGGILKTLVGNYSKFWVCSEATVYYLFHTTLNKFLGE